MFAFDNRYARLPDRFFRRIEPTKVSAPAIIKVNHPLAELLGIDASKLDSPEGAAIIAGNAIPEGAEPIALAYAGHQFGNFVPQLGDGRAILLGEVVGRDGVRRDIQLKGAGRTPFSRGGDGRAALGPVMREYIVSEAMFALGIPTTRALAAVTTGEPVIREEMLQGAVLARVATSHMRVGTFQFFAARQDKEAIATLAAHALDRHYPSHVGSGNDGLALLDCVVGAQAALVAKWLGVGFVHGVMNTDNTSISGETIDYGPCALLDEYNPKKKFSSIDQGGRYSFSNQPRIALWNLARLGEALLSIIHDDEEEAARLATEKLDLFAERFEKAFMTVLAAKVGISNVDSETDGALCDDLFERMTASSVDFTLFFRALCDAAESSANDAKVTALFEQPGAAQEWLEKWRVRLSRESLTPADRAASMRKANPAFIPRNHRVEEAIAAARGGDFTPFEALVKVLAHPFDEQPEFLHLAEAPKVEQRVTQTFCGT